MQRTSECHDGVVLPGAVDKSLVPLALPHEGPKLVAVLAEEAPLWPRPRGDHPAVVRDAVRPHPCVRPPILPEPDEANAGQREFSQSDGYRFRTLWRTGTIYL